MIRPLVWRNFTDVSKMSAASVIRAMTGGVSNCETSVNFYQTPRHNVPADSNWQEGKKGTVKLFSSGVFSALTGKYSEKEGTDCNEKLN
jgi:hypothetical protein